MSVKVHISVTKRYYARPLIGDPAGYYQVVHEDQPGGRYQWVWYEPGVVPGGEPRGEWAPTISEALEAAAKAWDDNGFDARTFDLARRLRLAAAAYRRHGS
jgi:hypothetical protein